VTATVPITAAIAAYERPAGLRRCIEAILTGEVWPAEIVVVDQSVSDDVARALGAYGTDRVPITYHRQAKLGLSASRNAAIMAGQQPIIAFTDDDCVPAAGWLAAAARALGTNDTVSAVAGRVLPFGDEQPGTYIVSPRVGADRMDFRGRATPWVVGTGGNFVVRREWVERVGGFDSRLGAGSPGQAAEDADLIYRLLAAGATIRYEPEAIVFHERQTAAQRLRSRSTYGYGIGAFCGLHLRRGDLYAGRLLLTWLGKQSVALGRAAARGDGFLFRQRMRSLGGGTRGFFHGLRLR